MLSHEEQHRFIQYLLEDMDACQFGVLLALFTGMRIGELCALQWACISLQEKTLSVTATLQRLRDTERMDVDGARESWREHQRVILL